MILTLKPSSIAMIFMAVVPMSSTYYCDQIYESTCILDGINDLGWNFEISDVALEYSDSETINTIRFTSCNVTVLSSTTLIIYSSGNIEITTVDLSCNHISALLKFHFTVDDLLIANISRNEITNLESSSIFDAHPKLLSIDLSFNRITSIGSDAFNGLSRLLILLLNENQLKEINGLMFARLVQLNSLELSANLIEKFENVTFGALNKLERLNLQRNNFLEFDFDHLSSLDELQEICLGDNNDIDFLSSVGHLKFVAHLKLSKIIQSNLAAWCKSASIVDSKVSMIIVSTEVESIVATNSSITKLIFNEHNSALRIGNFSRNLLTGHLSFENFEKLENLDLSFNRIQSLSFANRTIIEKLNLSHNNLTFIQNLTGLTNLEILDLSFNCIENLETYTFSNFTLLRVLNLRQTCLKSLDYGTFSFQTELRVLDVSYNNLNMIDLEILSAQRFLEDLMVDGDNLTNIQSIDMIGDFLPNLVSIGLTHNHWNCKTLVSIINILNQVYVRLFVENSIKHTTNVKGIGCTTLNSTQETLFIPKHSMPINHTMYMDKVEKINAIIGNVNDLKDKKNDREIIANAINELRHDKYVVKSNFDNQINQFKRFGKEIVNKFELLNEINVKKLMTMKAIIIKLNRTNNQKYVLIAQSIESLKDKLKLIQLKSKQNFTENINKIAMEAIKNDSDYNDVLSTLKTLEICLIALIFVLFIVALYFVLVYC